MTPTESRFDAALRARLAATPLREPEPAQVRRWQAVLRELPPPRRPGDGSSTSGAVSASDDPASAEQPESTVTERPSHAGGSRPDAVAGPPADPSAGCGHRDFRTTPPSSDPSATSTGAPTSADIRIVAAAQPTAMATRVVSRADADVAVAKIRRVGFRPGVAAAIGGLAAAITAVAVVSPSATTRSPAAATSYPLATGPAATAAGWPKGPSTDRPATRPTDHPSGADPSRPTDLDPGAQPLTLTREQLLAAPPTGRDLGPLAAPGVSSACLVRFGSTAQPVAARRVVLDGRAGVLLVLPTELPGRLRLLVVDLRCATALADDIVGR